MNCPHRLVHFALRTTQSLVGPVRHGSNAVWSPFQPRLPGHDLDLGTMACPYGTHCCRPLVLEIWDSAVIWATKLI